MSTKLRWVLASALVAVAILFALLRGKKEVQPVLPPPPDIAREDASKLPPKILKFSPAEVDFGEVLLGQRKTIQLTVENPSARPITLFRVLFSCTCLSGGLNQTVVPAGDSIRVPIVFTGQPGKRSWSTFASLITDEPGAAKYEIPIRGRIQQDFIVEPETLSFGKIEKGKSATLDAVIQRRDGKDFNVVEIKSARPELAFSWKPGEEGKSRSFRISVSARGLIPGVQSDTVSILTDRGADVSPQLTLAFEVDADVTCEPPVAIGAQAPGKLIPVFETLLRHRKGTAMKLESVKEAREFPVEYTESTGTDGSLKLRIHFKDGIPEGPPLGEFLIQLAGDPEPIRLPYRVEESPAATPDKP